MLITKNRGKILSYAPDLGCVRAPPAAQNELELFAAKCCMVVALKSGNIICQNAKTLKLAVTISLNAPALTALRTQNTASAESKKVRNSFAPTAINSFSPHHDPLHNYSLARCRLPIAARDCAIISQRRTHLAKKPACAGFILICIDFPRAYCIVVPVFIFKRYLFVPKNDRYCQSV